jgi:N4-gp56 family major capsid protein
MQTFSNFSSDAQTYIAAKTLMRIKRDVVVYGLGKKEKLPSRFSKTFQYTRYDKLDLPYSALSEGVTPDSSDISISTVSATMDQWGSFVYLTDVVDLTVKHPVMQQAIELLGEQAAETIDREVIKVLLANTNVYYGGTATSRVSLASNSYLSTTVAKKAIADLRSSGARGVSGRMFYGLIDPFIEADLLEDTTFQNAASYSNIVALQNGEVGKWMGVRWMVSNLIPTLSRLTDVSSASSGAASGTLANSTTYYFKVVAVDNATGFEVATTQIQSQATGMADEAVSITMPATTGRKYNVYFGDSNSNSALYLSSSLNDPSDVVVVLASPASGNNPPAHPDTNIEVHFSWVMGSEAFAVPELMSLQTFVTPKGASDSDPLAQRRKASWKVMFKAVICNELFLARIESASRY